MPATFVATLRESESESENEFELEFATEGPPVWRIRCGDRTLELDAVRLPSGTWSIIYEQRSLLVDVERGVDGALAIYVDGERTELRLEDARTRKFAAMVNHASGVSSKGETLRAPIAGKVVKLVVAVGDEVAAGDPVIVLEAMKMENELAASRDGAVKSISVSEGDSVETGQTLVTLA